MALGWESYSLAPTLHHAVLTVVIWADYYIDNNLLTQNLKWITMNPRKHPLCQVSPGKTKLDKFPITIYNMHFYYYNIE